MVFAGAGAVFALVVFGALAFLVVFIVLAVFTGHMMGFAGRFVKHKTACVSR
jgi:hypothetical protein